LQNPGSRCAIPAAINLPSICNLNSAICNRKGRWVETVTALAICGGIEREFGWPKSERRAASRSSTSEPPASQATNDPAWTLIVGAHALAAHGVPRATGDLDIWVRPTGDNAARVLAALDRFGAPLFDLTLEDLTRPDTVFQIGLPPSRVDILSGISGVEFEAAWSRRRSVTLDGVQVHVLAREDFIANKRASGRPKDLLDLALLDEADRQG
jgi:hypothetical protein